MKLTDRIFDILGLYIGPTNIWGKEYKQIEKLLSKYNRATQKSGKAGIESLSKSATPSISPKRECKHDSTETCGNCGHLAKPFEIEPIKASDLETVTGSPDEMLGKMFGIVCDKINEIITYLKTQ